MVIAKSSRLADIGSQAHRQKAAAAGRTQAVLARIAMQALLDRRSSTHRLRWIQALQHRIGNPDGTLAELGQTMTPPMTKHAYAALLRRAPRGGTAGDETGDLVGSRCD